MISDELQEKLKTILGWRVGSETAAYIQTRLLGEAPHTPFPILAHDARTGQPLRPMLDPNRLMAALPAEVTPAPIQVIPTPVKVMSTSPKAVPTPAGQMLLFPIE
jgi:hypothetical protein